MVSYTHQMNDKMALFNATFLEIIKKKETKKTNNNNNNENLHKIISSTVNFHLLILRSFDSLWCLRHILQDVDQVVVAHLHIENESEEGKKIILLFNTEFDTKSCHGFSDSFIHCFHLMDEMLEANRITKQRIEKLKEREK